MVKWAYNSFWIRRSGSRASIFMAQSSFRSVHWNLFFVFFFFFCFLLSNKLLSPWFIHCSFLPCTECFIRCFLDASLWFSLSFSLARSLFALNRIRFRFNRVIFIAFSLPPISLCSPWIVILSSVDSLVPIVCNLYLIQQHLLFFLLLFVVFIYVTIRLS